MRSPGLTLGRVHGIEVSMDAGIIPLIGILTYLLSTSILPAAAPGHVALSYWSVGVLASILFISALLVHELAHSVVATCSGIRVKRISLWFLGGFAELESEPERPGTAFAVAAAGPLASLGFGGLLFGLSWAVGLAGGPQIYVSALGWVGLINLALGVFNLLPGSPLDGGHMLAAAIWKIRNSRSKGALAATMGGRLIGMAIASFGVFELSRGSSFGLWNIAIGLMLYQSARYQDQALRLETRLGDLTVSQMMDSQPWAASVLSTVSQAMEATHGIPNQSAVPILNHNGSVMALVELSELRAVPKKDWASTTALAATGNNMDFVVASPTERVVDVLHRLNSRGRRHAAVTVDGDFVGLIGPEQIMVSGPD